MEVKPYYYSVYIVWSIFTSILGSVIGFIRAPSPSPWIVTFFTAIGAITGFSVAALVLAGLNWQLYWASSLRELRRTKWYALEKCKLDNNSADFFFFQFGYDFFNPGKFFIKATVYDMSKNSLVHSCKVWWMMPQKKNLHKFLFEGPQDEHVNVEFCPDKNKPIKVTFKEKRDSDESVNKPMSIYPLSYTDEQRYVEKLLSTASVSERRDHIARKIWEENLNKTGVSQRVQSKV